MLRFGKISEYNGSKGLARVRFEDDDVVSDWLPITVQQSKDTKFSAPLDVDEHVACMMDSNSEIGVVLGAIYSQDENPEGGGKDIYCVEFKNGDRIEYKRDTREYNIKIGASEFKVKNATGFTMKKGSESLKTILSDLMVALQAETHPTAVGPTGVPMNVASYVALQARLGTLFEA